MLIENDKCREMQIDARRSVLQLPPPPPNPLLHYEIRLSEGRQTGQSKKILRSGTAFAEDLSRTPSYKRLKALSSIVNRSNAQRESHAHFSQVISSK